MLATATGNHVVTVNTHCYGGYSEIIIEHNSTRIARTTIKGETSLEYSELSFINSNNGIRISYKERYLDGDRYNVSLLLPPKTNDFSGRMISANDRVSPELKKYILFTLGDLRRATARRPITAKAIKDYYANCGRRK